MTKRIKNHKYLIILLAILFFFMFISSDRPFSNLTYNQKIMLAQAYYKVALYYYSNNNKEKGDAFKSVAQYLDPNFVQKEISVIPKPITDEELAEKIKNIKENADKFIKEFFKTKDKKYLSYPVYNLKTADLFTDESIDALLEIDDISYFFKNDYKIEKTDFQKASNLSSFLPLVYLNDDLLYILRDDNNQKILIVLLRNFALDIKIIGLLPVQSKTTISK